MARPSWGGPSGATRPRPRPSYRELSDDDDLDRSEAVNPSSSRPSQITPTRRSHRATSIRPTYNEESSSTSSSPSSDENSDRERQRHATRERRVKQQNTAVNPRKRMSAAPSTQATQSPSKKRRIETASAIILRPKSPTSPTNSGHIPPWQTLPYHILLQIFQFASFPLYDSALRPAESIYWLLDSSRLCASFHDAAIATLLKSPPLYPSYRARDLIRLLKKTQESLWLNYQTKIQRLDVEVKHLLIKKRPLDLPAIIRHAPHLKHLRLFHGNDEMGATLWSRPSAKSKKWDYDLAIFDALDECNTILRSLEWNGRFPSSNKVIEDMAKMHERSSLQRLESLTLLNLSTSDKAAEQENGKYEILLAGAISKLPEIKRLNFKNCTVVNDRLIQRLPLGLESLTMVDCVSLTSSELSGFLRDKGTSLIELILNSNQSLNLQFADKLADCCPNLRTLKMDLTYYDASAYHDVEPYFDDLLPTGPPTWPSSLQTIDLAQLRKWDTDAVDGFYQSLADSAPSLPHLRHLSLKVILKSSWRDRATLRNKWKTKLEKIFLRKWEPPSDSRSIMLHEAESVVVHDRNLELRTQNADNYQSFQQVDLPEDEDQVRNLRVYSSRPSTSSSTGSTNKAVARKSSRIPVVTAQREAQLQRESELTAAAAAEAAAKKQAAIEAKKRALQVQQEADRAAKARTRKGKAASIDHANDEEENETPEDDEPIFVQGLVTTFTFLIDAQRPSESQFTEGDFIDEEMSGDEEWKGIDVNFEDEWVKRRGKGRGRKYAW